MPKRIWKRIDNYGKLKRIYTTFIEVKSATKTLILYIIYLLKTK